MIRAHYGSRAFTSRPTIIRLCHKINHLLHARRIWPELKSIRLFKYTRIHFGNRTPLVTNSLHLYKTIYNNFAAMIKLPVPYKHPVRMPDFSTAMTISAILSIMGFYVAINNRGLIAPNSTRSIRQVLPPMTVRVLSKVLVAEILIS